MSSTLSGSFSSLFQLEQIQNETQAPVPEREQAETEEPSDETPAEEKAVEEDEEDEEEPQDVRRFLSAFVIHSPYILTFCRRPLCQQPRRSRMHFVNLRTSLASFQSTRRMRCHCCLHPTEAAF